MVGCMHITIFLFFPLSCSFDEVMRDRMEKLVVLPFSIGCVSYSSVAVVDNQPKKTKEEPNPSSTRLGEYFSGEELKNSYGLLPTPKANTSSGLQRLIKAVKSFSHIFAYKEEVLGAMEMEIGFPTDVKHVTHIGWDSSITNTTIESWNGLTVADLLSLPCS